MKKILVLIAVLLTISAADAMAQRYSHRGMDVVDAEFMVDANAGVGLNKAMIFDAGASFCAGIRTGVQDRGYLGLGLGIEVAEPIYATSVEGKNKYATEFVLPVFLRGKYDLVELSSRRSRHHNNYRYGSMLYGLVDLGYKVNLGGIPIDKISPRNLKGLYVEPQLGIDFASGTFFSIGVQGGKFKYTVPSSTSEPARGWMFTIHLGRAF